MEYALFDDVLKPAAIYARYFSKMIWCIVKAIECIFKVKVSLDKLHLQSLPLLRKLLTEFRKRKMVHSIYNLLK